MRHRLTSYTLLLIVTILIISPVACIPKIEFVTKPEPTVEPEPILEPGHTLQPEPTLRPAPVLEWSKTFDFNSSSGNSVQQTTDGGYIVNVSLYPGFAMVKTDKNGNKIWDKKFDCIGNSIQQTTDGGYIVCGYTGRFGAGDEDVWLMKTDADGNKIWDKTWGGGEDDIGKSVQQTADGGYMICGVTSPHEAPFNEYTIWLVKTDADGNKLWERTFNKDPDMPTQVIIDRDGNVISCGTTYNPATDTDFFLMKNDANGNRLWKKVFGGKYMDQALSMQQTADGGYILCGFTESYGDASGDIFLMKTDADGNRLWGKIFGGKREDWGHSVQQTRDGGYIICGDTASFGEGEADVPIIGSTKSFRLPTTDLWLIKTDENGNMLWDKTFGGKNDEGGDSVQQITDGGYIVCGYTWSYGSGESSAAWLLKIAPEQ